MRELAVRQGMRRLRGAVGMGLTWGVAWAVVGVLIGVSSLLLPGLPWAAFFAFYDAPLPTLGLPGFVGGALFSLVLGTVGRRRRFDELSLRRFAAWGALGGLLLALVPAALVALGLATVTGLWQLTAIVVGPLVLLSAASASGSLAVARAGEVRALPHAGERVPPAAAATRAGRWS